MAKLDLDLVPIKYILGTFRDEEGYPSPDDIIYLMTKRASSKGKSLNPVKFTTTVLFKSVGNDLKEAAEKSIEELKNKGIIELNKETKTGYSYKIIKNKFL